jgi:hypothetical protein
MKSKHRTTTRETIMCTLAARILRASILATVWLPAYGLAAVHLGFDKSNYTTSPGGTVQVQVRIDGLVDSAAPSLGAFGLAISYDGNILRPTGVVYGDPVLGNQLNLGGLGDPNLPPTIAPPLPVGIGAVSFDTASTLDTQQKDAFTLATITFSALAFGSSALGISVLSLADAQGDPLTATLSGATVVVPEPSAVTMLIVGLLGMMGWAARRRIG